MSQNLSLNQFALSRVKGTLDNSPNLNTITRRINSASVDTFYPGDVVTLTSTGSVSKALANSNDLGVIAYNPITNVHTATSFPDLIIALDSCQITMEAGATILAGQSLEFNPTGSVVIPFANTGNTIIGYALQGATTGNSFLMVIKTKNY